MPAEVLPPDVLLALKLKESGGLVPPGLHNDDTLMMSLLVIFCTAMSMAMISALVMLESFPSVLEIILASVLSESLPSVLVKISALVSGDHLGLNLDLVALLAKSCLIFVVVSPRLLAPLGTPLLAPGFSLLLAPWHDEPPAPLGALPLPLGMMSPWLLLALWPCSLALWPCSPFCTC